MSRSAEIRKQFLDFFQSKKHLIVPSAPVVLKDDPTLMFTNSGMAQFKDAFLGIKQPPALRVADTQKCLRVSGKHNDLEDVGHDTYHHTMFEMLGNWSFGEYYKKEAIAWAWELLTEVYQLPKDRLYVTVFGGDEGMGLGMDEEAKEEWSKFIDPARILAQTRKDNFWEMGDTGPCGPCSEIHVDLRPDAERATQPGIELVNKDHPQVVEIWNLVFMEFVRKADTSLHPLPAKNVDTGMGFERLCMAIEGTQSTYDISLFAPLKAFLEKELKCQYGRDEKESIAMRVVMDHIRTVTFAIADGQVPSNTGAGYVIRRVLRRASRYAFQYLNQSEPFLHRMVSVMATIYAGIFPEVKAQAAFIARIVEEEEKGFLKKLERGIAMFEEYVQTHRAADRIVNGEFAFTLYDTFGFPIDLTQLMAREKGWTVDMPVFEGKLAEQKNRSRLATEVKSGDWVTVNPMQGFPPFIGYDELQASVQIVQFRVQESKKGKIYQIVLNETPFYPEGGGEVGDTGRISNGEETLNVLDTRRENDLIVHFVDQLPEKPEGNWTATVDAARRQRIRANHSATHLLHAALRQVLGTHVEQRGSLVSPDLLRFDFSHFAKMTEEELREVETLVNSRIAAGVMLDERRAVPIEEAKALGAMALFGEKYGEKVRVIIFDPQYSIELCGGCHVRNTAEIRLFRIVSESSIAAGIRRVEAITGEGAIAYLSQQEDTLKSVSAALKNPKDVLKAIDDLQGRNRELEKKIEELNHQKVQQLREGLKARIKAANGYNLLNEVVEVGTADDLKTLAFELRKSQSNTLVVLGALIDGKPLLNVILTEDLEKSGRFNATQVIKQLAAAIQGGGGGQPFYASAGGKKPEGLADAVKAAESLG